jgi:hypothetical protein
VKSNIAVTTDELLTTTEDLYLLGAITAARVGQLYLFREVFRDRDLAGLLLDHLPKLATETDPRKIAELEAEFRQNGEKLFVAKL